MTFSRRRQGRLRLGFCYAAVAVSLSLIADVSLGLNFGHSAPLPPTSVSPAPSAPPTVVLPDEVALANPQATLRLRHALSARVPMAIVEGGVAGTQRAARRCAVGAFVARTGAQAGLNGAFFADASLRGHDSAMIGPTLCGGDAAPTRGACDGAAALAGRPLVLLSPTRTCVVPYLPTGMDDEAALRRMLPDVTDAFLGGVWLVHNGVAATADQIAQFQVHDAEDFRRRAFFVLEPDGRPGIGATTDVTSSQRLARALQGAGVREAVLLDSGFSTSLVFGKKIVVTGHTAPGIPSRPVPHAVLLYAARPVPSSPRARRSRPRRGRSRAPSAPSWSARAPVPRRRRTPPPVAHAAGRTRRT